MNTSASKIVISHLYNINPVGEGRVISLLVFCLNNMLERERECFV